MPCRIKLLPIEKGAAAFHDFEEYERLVDVAREIDQRTYLIVLLGGEAGLRCGEMIALEWGDVDLAKRQLCVRRSDWNGQVGTPKGGRQRYVPLTRRLTAALAEHRHLRSKRVFCQDDRTPFTRQIVQNRMILAARRANVRRGIHILRHHVLLAPLDARGAAEGDPGARRACGSDDDAALHAPQSGSPRRGDRAAGTAVRRTKLWRYIGNGESVARMINKTGD
jgi:integrase